MKLLYIIQCLNHGGMEASLFNILDELAPSHEIVVCSLHEPTKANKLRLKTLGVSHFTLGYGPYRGFGSIPQIRKIVGAFSPDAIFSIGHSFAVTSALFFVRDKGIYKEHNIHFHHRGVRPKAFWFLYYLLACNVFNCLTFPSNPNRIEASKYILPIFLKKLHTQYNIVKKKELLPSSCPSLLDCRPTLLRFGFCGWLIDRKRPDLFLDFASRINQIIPGCKFIIAGDGPLLRSLVERVNALGLASHFSFLGVLSKMDDFYNSIDVVCFFSESEAAGLVPLEAFAYRKLLVSSTKNYGLQEYLHDGVNCINVTNHSIDELVVKFNAATLDWSSIVNSGYSTLDCVFTPEAFLRTLTLRSGLLF